MFWNSICWFNSQINCSVRFSTTGVSSLKAKGCFKLVLFSSTMLWEDWNDFGKDHLTLSTIFRFYYFDYMAPGEMFFHIVSSSVNGTEFLRQRNFFSFKSAVCICNLFISLLFTELFVSSLNKIIPASSMTPAGGGIRRQMALKENNHNWVFITSAVDLHAWLRSSLRSVLCGWHCAQAVLFECGPFTFIEGIALRVK